VGRRRGALSTIAVVSAARPICAIAAGGSSATITPAGATIETLVIAGHPMLEPPDRALPPTGGCHVLAPWPNRVEDGTFTFDGIAVTVPINEPRRQNATNGLVRWLEWNVLEHTERSVTLDVAVPVQPAYPWRIRLTQTYAFEDDVFVARTVVHNEGDRRAPFGLGFHPNFVTGSSGVDDAFLEVPARTRLIFDARRLPIGVDPIPGGPMARLSEPGGLPLAGTGLDECYGDLRRGPDGQCVVRLRPGAPRPDVRITLSREWSYVMCFTGGPVDEQGRRRSISVEPMTCAPNALRSGDGIVGIEPDGTFSAFFAVALD
jgi:aldose 1-epimerase